MEERLRDVYLTGDDARGIAFARKISAEQENEFDYGIPNEMPVVYEEGMAVGEEVEARGPTFRLRAKIVRIVAYVELV